MSIRQIAKKWPALVLILGSLGASLSGCGRAAKADESGHGLARSETFYVAGRQWGEPSSFNPLSSNPDWPITGGNLMYETLLLYNSQTGKMEPLLAESYEQRPGSIEVTLNPAARWSDGRPVTGWDAKYSFDLGRKYKSLLMSPVWPYLREIRLLDANGKVVPDVPTDTKDYPRRVEFVLNPERLNPLVILDGLQEFRIVPRHVIEPLFNSVNGNVEEIGKLKFDQEPVLSGPYQLKLYSSEKIVLERRPDYWGNDALYGGQVPKPRYVVHPIYKSNDHFSVALQQGRLDMSSTFVPRIWLKHKKGVHSWLDDPPYFQTSALPMLFINVKHRPLEDVAMRRAMAFAINYTDVRELAMSGYSEPLQPGLILPFGTEAKYYSEEDAKKYGATYDPERARALLKEAGYVPKFNDKGELVETRDKNGVRVPTVFIKSPTGWGDWESIVRIAVKSMRDVGIDVRERFVDASLFWNATFLGDFDLIMNTPTSPPSPSKPWSRFETVLTTQDFAPEGDKMYKNMGRFNDPKAPGYIARIDDLLAKIPTMHDEAEKIAAYRELNILFMQQQPTLPLVYRADQLYEFSTRHWENFPTAKNPYLPPQVAGERLGTRMLWKLTPVAESP